MLNNASPLVRILGIGGLLIFFGYALFVSSAYLLGPRLSVTSPAPFGIEHRKTVTVTGTTARVNFLTLNGLPVPILEDGSFALERAAPPGYTVFILHARDRFGREVEKSISFLRTTNHIPHGTENR